MSGSPRWTAQKRACTVAPHPFCHWEPGGNGLPDRYVRQMCNLCDCRYYMRARSHFRRKMSSVTSNWVVLPCSCQEQLKIKRWFHRMELGGNDL